MFLRLCQLLNSVKRKEDKVYFAFTTHLMLKEIQSNLSFSLQYNPSASVLWYIGDAFKKTLKEAHCPILASHSPPLGTLGHKDGTFPFDVERPPSYRNLGQFFLTIFEIPETLVFYNN